MRYEIHALILNTGIILHRANREESLLYQSLFYAEKTVMS